MAVTPFNMAGGDLAFFQRQLNEFQRRVACGFFGHRWDGDICSGCGATRLDMAMAELNAMLATTLADEPDEIGMYRRRAADE